MQLLILTLCFLFYKVHVYQGNLISHDKDPEKGLVLCLLVYKFCVCQENLITQDKDPEIGYYWKEYRRDIPSDALPGGVDKRGKTTYIGQTVHTISTRRFDTNILRHHIIRFRRSNGIVNGNGGEITVPGPIREAEQKMTYAWGYKELVAKDNVKILCTHHPEQFEWVVTNGTDMLNLGKDFVIGGTQNNYSIYIGRIFLEDELAIGKVPIREGFYGTLDGRYLHIQSPFEVLAYNKSAPLINEKPVKLLLRSKFVSYNSSTADGKRLLVEASYQVFDNITNARSNLVPLKLKSNLGSIVLPELWSYSVLLLLLYF